MPTDVETGTWDVITLIAWWNLYGLPVLLFLVATAVMIRRLRQGSNATEGLRLDSRGDSSREPLRATIRLIALIHLGLAIRAGIGLVQELLSLREQGIPQSNPVTGFIIPVISIPANLAIGHGLWRIRPWGRRVAIGWDLVVVVVTALVLAWQVKHGATVWLDQWPDYLIFAGLPWFLLVVMLLPGTRALFSLTQSGTIRGTKAGGEPIPPRSFDVLWLMSLLLLIVLLSTTLMDASDWLVRSLSPGME